HQQHACGDEHRRPTQRPVGAQPGGKEVHRHHRQQHVVAERVEPFQPEPVAIHHRAGEEGAHHEVQAAPVRAVTAGGEPDQSEEIPIRFAQPEHYPAESHRRQREHGKECDLMTDASPVQQDHGQHGPDGEIVEAGVAQHALAQRLAKDAEFFQEQDQDRQRRHGAGHADAQHELPGGGRLAHPAIAPGQQAQRGEAAREQRHAEGERRRGAAFATLPPYLTQVQFDAGDPHEDHHGPPRDAVQRRDHGRREHGGVILRKHTAQHARTQRDAGEDLHYDQRCPVIGSQHTPYE
ncbi:hypothetical protein KCV01_g24981, partial [Aureobasidium melanogenum]